MKIAHVKEQHFYSTSLSSYKEVDVLAGHQLRWILPATAAMKIPQNVPASRSQGASGEINATPLI